MCSPILLLLSFVFGDGLAAAAAFRGLEFDDDRGLPFFWVPPFPRARHDELAEEEYASASTSEFPRAVAEEPSTTLSLAPPEVHELNIVFRAFSSALALPLLLVSQAPPPFGFLLDMISSRFFMSSLAEAWTLSFAACMGLAFKLPPLFPFSASVPLSPAVPVP